MTNVAEITNLAEHLQRTEDRIRGLVRFIADGDDSRYVRDALRDLEVQAQTDTGAIAALQADQRQPTRLPSPEALLERARDLDQVIGGEPMRGREALRGLLHDGKVTMHPQDDGSYVAEFAFLRMVIVEAGCKANARADVVAMTLVVPKPPDRRRR